MLDKCDSSGHYLQQRKLCVETSQRSSAHSQNTPGKWPAEHTLVNAAVCQLAVLCPIDLPLLTACCHLTLAHTHTHTEIRGSASKMSTAWAQSHRPVPGIDCIGCFRKHESKAGKVWAVPTRLWGTHAGTVYTWYLDMLLVIWSVWHMVEKKKVNVSDFDTTCNSSQHRLLFVNKVWKKNTKNCILHSVTLYINLLQIKMFGSALYVIV